MLPVIGRLYCTYLINIFIKQYAELYVKYALYNWVQQHLEEKVLRLQQELDSTAPSIAGTTLIWVN